MRLIFGFMHVLFWYCVALQAEKAKLEPEATRGHLQSSCYACRFFGLMIAAPFSTAIYSKFGPRVVVFLMGAVPLAVLPLVYNFWEPRNMEVKNVHSQCMEIWNTVCSRAVWQPMGFVSRLSPLAMTRISSICSALIRCNATAEFCNNFFSWIATGLPLQCLAGRQLGMERVS